MTPAQQRLAELSTINKRRALTAEELTEIAHCLTVNAAYCWEMRKLEELSLLASATHDVDWQHDLCARIEQLQLNGRVTRP